MPDALVLTFPYQSAPVDAVEADVAEVVSRHGYQAVYDTLRMFEPEPPKDPS